MSSEETQSAKPKGRGGASKLLILGLLVCNVVSLGGLGAFVVLSGSSQSEAAPNDVGGAGLDDGPGAPQAGAAEKEGRGADAAASGDEDAIGEDGISYSASDLGPTVKVGNFTINLNDPGHPRYLKVTLKAEVSSDGTKGELRARDPQVRDIIISYLSSLRIKETYGARAKATIRDNIQRRLNHILTTGEVKRVFFTDFMTQ